MDDDFNDDYDVQTRIGGTRLSPKNQNELFVYMEYIYQEKLLKFGEN